MDEKSIIQFIEQQTGSERRITSAQAVSFCCNYFKISKEAFFSRSKSRDITNCRHHAMYILKNYTVKSYPEIARDLGNLDHTTVMYGFRRIKGLVEKDSVLEREIAEMVHKIKLGDGI